MSAIPADAADPHLEWLAHVRPTGLVIGPNILRAETLVPERQSALDTETVAECLREPNFLPRARAGEGDRKSAEALAKAGEAVEGAALADHWGFFQRVLGWEARYVAGAPDGPPLPDELARRIAEHDVTLAPDWAVRELGEAGGFQLLVKLHPDADADERRALGGWEATPHSQFERLLKETNIPIGVLVDREELRLVYAPRGETSGWMSFPLASLGTVAGRIMLGGLKLMLGHARLFTEPAPRRLPALFTRSREAQNEVSKELAGQVLGALHELLRAFHAADPARIEALAARDPHHLYEGLLTTLLRLVFLLYAEDRDLMPTERTRGAKELYDNNYSLRGLYARLAQDRALNPDTMDERVGAWGQLLALFRLVHGGWRGWIAARGGKLFDPNVFPFLEGRDAGSNHFDAKILDVSDGAILRILEGLMTLEARAITGERVRERLSYRSLDVEQIGSVYETVMGFTVLRANTPMLAVKGEKNLPVFVELQTLAEMKGVERQKLLKEQGVVPSGKRLEAIRSAATIDELMLAMKAILDERGSPGGHVAQAGAPILQPTDERRRTGSHYTPRSLTEPIVRHALEPAFARLGENATPDEVLDLKICDPACGSGAFLVEACRQLGARLELAWARHKHLKPVVPADERDNEDIFARRLVAQRCLYGVDKNPMAVDLARLSLWLATLAREHEFTFLDHAIKSGDSLVGLTRAQIAAANWDESKPGLTLLGPLIARRVNETVAGRHAIQFAPDNVGRATLEAQHRNVEKGLEQVRLYGDAVIAAFFSAEKAKAREENRAEVESLLMGGGTPSLDKLTAIAATLKQGAHPITPFHWELEFPEVLERDNPGFDAIVANPPFLGVTGLGTAGHTQFTNWLRELNSNSGGKSDLIAFFLRKMFRLVRELGVVGSLATKTVAQGDTRRGGLSQIIQTGGTIIRARTNVFWPGEASVVVSALHLIRGQASHATLNDTVVGRLSAFLKPGDGGEPKLIDRRPFSAFLGAKPQGLGFVVESGDQLLENLTASERQHVVGYLRGEMVNELPVIRFPELIIDVNSLDLAQVERMTGLYTILRTRVWPERRSKSGPLKERWWRFGFYPRQLEAVRIHKTPFIITARTSNTFGFQFCPTEGIVNDKVICFDATDFGAFAFLQCRVHEVWARVLSATRTTDLQYTPTDCFDTLPFPRFLEHFESAGEKYHEFRTQLMVARNEGLTKTYNRFHGVYERSADIERLRELHAEMDRAVLRAYGWNDLADAAAPEFLTPETEDDHTYQNRLFWPSDFRDEVLARLLKLNAERHAEEVRLGLVKKNPIAKSRQTKVAAGELLEPDTTED